MTNEKLDRVLDKVRKLIALSESSNEHEASLALERAQAILAEYNLSIADVEKDSRDPKYHVFRSPVSDPLPYRRWLCEAVARLYFCVGGWEDVPKMSRSGKVYMRDRHVMVGEAHNGEVAISMFQYIVTSVDRLAVEAGQHLKGRSGYWSFLTAFKVACAARVCKRIDARIKAASSGEVVTESGTTLPALASLYDDAQKRINEFLGGGFDNVESRNREYDSDGFAAGQVAGDKISLDAQVGGGTPTKQLK